MNTRKLFPAISIIASLTLAACGGGGDSTTAGPQADGTRYVGNYESTCTAVESGLWTKNRVDVNIGFEKANLSVVRSHQYFSADTCLPANALATFTRKADSVTLVKDGKSTIDGKTVEKTGVYTGVGEIVATGSALNDAKCVMFTSGGAAKTNCPSFDGVVSVTSFSKGLIALDSNDQLFFGSSSIGADGFPTGLDATKIVKKL